MPMKRALGLKLEVGWSHKGVGLKSGSAFDRNFRRFKSRRPL